MRKLQLPALKPGQRRSLFVGAATAAAALALWGTAQTTEPGAGEAPLLPVAASAQPETGSSREPEARIDFPRRAPARREATLFSAHSWYVPPPPPPPAKPVPPSPPSAPPLPFSYVGSYGTAGGVVVYYLVRGDQVFDVKVGDTLDGLYSVDASDGDELQLTYLPLKQKQALSLRR